MKLSIHTTPDGANVAATDCLANWLATPAICRVMVAAGNTPLELYRRLGERGLKLSHLSVFALDEYVGVPLDEPRSCANLMRRCVQEAWGIPPARFHAVSSLEAHVLASVQEHEHRIEEAGGLDVIILGLGQNGHLGFNEPGSPEDSAGRLLNLESCQCADYTRRQRWVPDCVRLTPDAVRQIDWLPPSCAYRRVDEGKDLAWWHPLVSGDPDTVHEAGISVRGKAVSEREAGPFAHHIVDWPNRPMRVRRKSRES